EDGIRVFHVTGVQTCALPISTSCAFALGFGLLGLALYLAFLQRFDARVMFVSMKIGGLALLLPIFFTVCHRMIPFFTSCVIPGYRVTRPLWVLGAFWALAIAHLWLELRHAYAWLWIADASLLALSAWMWWKWYPRNVAMPAL